MNKTELEKLIRGDLSQDKKREYLKELLSNPDYQKKYNLLKAKKIVEEIDKIENSDQTFNYRKFLRRRNYSNKAISLALFSVAAIFLLIFTLHFTGNNPFGDKTTFISKNHLNQISTGINETKKVNLPDGSQVVLNSQSTISFNSFFNDSIRNVRLIGEAFFEVKKDSSRPFVVKTDDLKVKVLGTSFNIKSYPDGDNVETTLVTGSVEVLSSVKTSKIVLNPSQKATYNRTHNSVIIDTVDSKEIIAWKSGKLVFNETPLEEVIKDLKRKYSVEFVIESDSLSHYRFTGVFNNLSLTESLQILEKSSSIKYKLKNNKVMISKSQ